MKVYSVYILRCRDKTYYTGISSNLWERVEEHQSGKYENSYTYNRRPIELVYYCEFTEPDLAIEFEKRIKNWSRVKKEALINGEYEKLPNLAKKNFQ
ncbi:GIY-YIG nuclease family protein [Leeuwenhoekiella sp. W20_SRS_FM14]|uniref:GIY-YIG nuclease family protein n=1 Tax=Leeuwenhoekiella sp. W20_SRS_FM14 TaxID=3240270 RepID=UPI003F977694